MRGVSFCVGKFHNQFRKRREKKKPKEKPHRPIKFPWQKTEKQILQERRDRHQLEKERPNKKIRRLRVKFPERHKPALIGPGYPGFGLAYANMEIARGDRDRKILKRTESGTPLIYEPLRTELPDPVPDNVFEEYCRRIGIERYKIEEPLQEPINAIDLKAFDLYTEDIRIERNIIIKEIKHLPLIAPVDIGDLAVIEKSLFNVSRSCYYSPICSHKKSEDVIHLMVWFLNRRNLPVAFSIKVIQAISLVVYHSPVFKAELVQCGGVRVLYRSMQVGMIVCGLQAAWACYCLAIACINSPDVIHELQRMPDCDETIGELTFGMYWYYWPTNFASILQALVFGPGGVSNSTNVFQIW